jgi:hypothetical protein
MLVDRGAVEITLLGQTVNSYVQQEDEREVRFAELLSRLNDIDGLERVRFVTSYPGDFTDDTLEAMRDLPKVCEYLHVPAQSGSDAVLKRMRRQYSVSKYSDFIDRARAYVPNITIASDFIVGFLAAIPYIAAPVTMLLVARHSDLSQERCLHVAVPSFLASAAFVGASYASTPSIAIFALTVAAAAMYARIGPLFAIPTLLFDGAPAAVAIAMMNTLGSIGGFVGPYAVGIVKNATDSYRGGLLFLAIAGALAGGIVSSSRGRKARHSLIRASFTAAPTRPPAPTIFVSWRLPPSP